MPSSRIIVSLIVSVLIAPVVFAHEDEIDVGHTAAGQLKAVVEFEQPLELPVSVFPGISGYATGLVGIHSVILDESGEDLFQFPPGPASFQFILVAKDPGIEVWNDTGSAFMSVGQSYFMGESPFDVHPIWNITTGTPGNSYTLTLKFHDTSGTYTDSDPITATFTPVPEPATVGFVFGLSLLGMTRRRFR